MLLTFALLSCSIDDDCLNTRGHLHALILSRDNLQLVVEVLNQETPCTPPLIIITYARKAFVARERGYICVRSELRGIISSCH